MCGVVCTHCFFSLVKKKFFLTSEKKVFFSQVKKNTAVSGILLLLQLLVLVFFLLQYTVSYSEDFFSRCEDFFPKQLSKTCGSYENIFSAEKTAPVCILCGRFCMQKPKWLRLLNGSGCY